MSVSDTAREEAREKFFTAWDKYSYDYPSADAAFTAGWDARPVVPVPTREQIAAVSTIIREFAEACEDDESICIPDDSDGAADMVLALLAPVEGNTK